MKTISLFFMLLLLTGFQNDKRDILLHQDFVKIRGGDATTVIKNNTLDTVHLVGTFFTYLPYKETKFAIDIAPGKVDSFRLTLTYPDFIRFDSHDFRVFNAPQKRLFCDIRNLKQNELDIKFKGELASINDYYLAHQLQFGSSQDSAPYYKVAQSLKTLNEFPALADSITQLSLEFLQRYHKDLPSWFKKHESRRLQYNASFRKYNVLFAREATEGSRNTVPESYFEFEKAHELKAKDMILNTEYFWYAMFYLNRKALQISKDQRHLHTNMLTVADSLTGNSLVGDILKMRILADLSRQSKAAYQAAHPTVQFHDPSSGNLLQSLLKDKDSLMGKAAPDFSLENMNGNVVSLKEFASNVIILNFWATWCKGCVEEFPFENKLHEAYSQRGLKVVNVCLQSDREKWKAFSHKYNLQMVNLYVPEDKLKMVQEQYQINYLPKSILLSPGLMVADDAFVKASLLSEKEVEALLKKYSDN